MKKILSILLLTGTVLLAQVPPPGIPSPSGNPAPGAPATTPGSEAVVTIKPRNRFNLSEAQLNTMVPAAEINFKGMNLDEFLQIYAEYVNRTILRPANLNATITVKNQTALTRREAIDLLDAVLALNDVATVPIGDKFMKVVPLAQAGTVGGPLDHGAVANLPEMGPYVTHVVQLKFARPAEMMPVIQPFAKIPNSILPIEGNNVLVIRDFAENVRRMVEMIEQTDISIPQVYTNKVIPIKYALASDIASALNSLGGGGGGTTVGGGSGGASSSRSTSRGAGMGGMGGAGGSRFGSGMGSLGVQGNTGYGGQPGAVGGAAGGTQPTFTDRLRSIINKASTPAGGAAGGGGDIQLWGQTKIIADERTNSLLIYATHEDLATIEDVISKLDVVLAQVLIESLILSVSGDNTLNYGVSAAQQPRTIGSDVVGAGVANNSKDLLGTGTQWFNNVASTNALSATPALGGLNYFGSIRGGWDVAVTALSSKGKTEVIQRPTIMTTHATPGQFFVGSTVPYVTSTYYGGSVYGGPSSSYQQLRVGIQLTVTPFINPDGIVVMKIDQAIEEIDTYVKIDGNDVPQTASRTLSADITVRDHDTIVLGGYMSSSGTKAKEGVPILQDIPLLGGLFRSTTDTKKRRELLVLMRPTVLKTPDLAAIGSKEEQRRLPGIYSFEHRLREEEKENAKKVKAMDAKWDSSNATFDDPQTERLRKAVRDKQSELETNSVPVEPAPMSAPAPAPRPVQPEASSPN